MDYSLILQNVSKYIKLDDKESEYFISLLSYRKVQKKEFLLKDSQVCDRISYIHQGTFRAFYRDDESNESIVMFGMDDWWITDMYSFSTQQPAMLNIDALEESVIFELRKEALEKLYSEVPKFERFFRILMQNSYVREQLRALQNLSMSAEERYLSFIKKYPLAVQRFPVKYIASYLGITPEFLSVIRKKAAKG